MSLGQVLDPCYKVVSLDKVASRLLLVFSTSERLAIMSLSLDSIIGVDEDLPVTRRGEYVKSPPSLDLVISLHAHLSPCVLHLS